MKTLPETFRSDHYDFTLLQRTGDIAMFTKTKENLDRNLYEVVRVQKRKEVTMFGNVVEAHEAMPSPEQWGAYGWSYSNPEDARAKFNALVTTGKNADS